MLDEQTWEHVVHGSPALRKAICEREPKYFAIYYFPEYFTFTIPPFHNELYDDCKHLTDGSLDEAVWCVFRDGAKTSLAKIALLAWCICFRKKVNIKWDSYENESGETALFDVTVALQTNSRIISDFGQLYYKKPTKQAMSEAKMKRIKNFKTENGVSVASVTTQQALRARNLQGSERTDLYICDDFENNKTKDSAAVTGTVIKHLDELRSGLPAGASVLYLCNYISDSGSVAHLMDKLRNSKRAVVRFVPVVSAKGEVMWPDKFVKTNAEALTVNRDIFDPKLRKVSLEAKRSALGDSVYETEYMLNPSKSGDLFFDRNKVEAAIAKAQAAGEENAGLRIWEKFNPKHLYGMGCDTSEGIGGDSNASAVIDFSPTPAKLCASFEDNQIAPNIFGWELKRQGALFGYPFLVPELNQTGYATIAELINAEYPLLYVREVKNKTTEKMQKEFGWKATTGTKFEIMGEFKSAFEDGQLEILDIRILSEMKFFTKQAARLVNREQGATRHFDLLRASALAWHAKNHAVSPHIPSTQKEKYRVPGQDTPYKP